MECYLFKVVCFHDTDIDVKFISAIMIYVKCYYNIPTRVLRYYLQRHMGDFQSLEIFSCHIQFVFTQGMIFIFFILERLNYF